MVSLNLNILGEFCKIQIAYTWKQSLFSKMWSQILDQNKMIWKGLFPLSILYKWSPSARYEKQCSEEMDT
jgi:hypothetical protein